MGGVVETVGKEISLAPHSLFVDIFEKAEKCYVLSGYLRPGAYFMLNRRAEAVKGSREETTHLYRFIIALLLFQGEAMADGNMSIST